MVRNNKVTLIVIGLAMGVFILTQIMPAFTSKKSTPAKPTSTGTTPMAPSNPFEHEANGWFISPSGDTLAALELELSQTQYEITRGLMHRREMAEHQGMVFEFTDEAPRAFWMKNTILSLDIIYLKANGSIDSYFENTQPYSETSLPSSGVAQYVLEVNAGYLKANNISDSTVLVYQSLENL